MGTQARAYTNDEVRDMIVEYAAEVAHYWASLPDIDTATGRRFTTLVRCEGVVHSVLAMLDGASGAIPAVNLKLMPHTDDKEYHKNEGENWFEPGMEIEDTLHEHLYRFRKSS